MSGSPVLFPETDPMGKDRKVFPGWKTKRCVPLIFQDCKCSIYLDLFGDCFFMMACLFFTCNPFAVKQTRTLLTAAVHHPKTQRPWISPAESKGLEIVDHCRPGKGHESTVSCIPDPSFSKKA